jgi:hypothetical protein
MVQYAMELIDKISDTESQKKLIDTLRTITEGKVRISAQFYGVLLTSK